MHFPLLHLWQTNAELEINYNLWILVSRQGMYYKGLFVGDEMHDTDFSTLQHETDSLSKLAILIVVVVVFLYCAKEYIASKSLT